MQNAAEIKKNCKYADDGSSGDCSESTMCEVGVFVALAAAFFSTYINVHCTYFAKHIEISLNTRV